MMTLNEDLLLDTFSERENREGYRYYSRGAVSGVSKPTDNTILGKVQGSAETPYLVSVHISESNRGLLNLEGSCSCPVGYNCKHCAALFHCALDEGLLDDMEDHIEAAPAAANRAPIAQIARPPSKPAAKLDDTLASWIAGLKRLTHVRPDIAAPNARNRLYYVFRVRETLWAGWQLMLEAESATLDRNGDLTGKSTKFQMHVLAKADSNLPKYLLASDIDILRRIFRLEPSHGGEGRAIMTNSAWMAVITDILATGRARLGSVDGLALEMGPQIDARLAWSADANGKFRAGLELPTNPDPAVQAFVGNPPFYLDKANGLIGRLDLGVKDELSFSILKGPPIEPAQLDLVREAMEEASPLLQAVAPPRLTPIEQRDVAPVPVLTFLRKELPTEIQGRNSCAYHMMEDVLLASPSFSYDGAEIRADANDRNLRQTKGLQRYEYPRKMDDERQALRLLQSLGFEKASKHRPKSAQRLQGDLLFPQGMIAWLNFFENTVPDLRRQGWIIRFDKSFPYNFVFPDKGFQGEIRESSGIDWLELDFGVQIDGAHIDLAGEIARLLSHPHVLSGEIWRNPDSSMIITLRDGRHLPLMISKLRGLIEPLLELSLSGALQAAGKALKVHRRDAVGLAALEAGSSTLEMAWRGGDNLRALGRKLREQNGIPEIAPPSDFRAELRPYQKQGLSWMAFLAGAGLGGILADDMGLGKTVQALALIASEKALGRLEKPVLIVAPTSLMVNWAMEAEKFCPDINVLTLQGSNRKALFGEIDKADIVLTTYPLIARDKQVLTGRDWGMIFLDEAQTIKNAAASTTKLIHDLKSERRFCLTGTPLENHLGELWSLFHFVMPGFLGASDEFRRNWRTPIEKKGDSEKARMLANRIRPFLLRRRKLDVATELPPKTEIMERVSMEAPQRAVYETIRLAMHDKVREAIKNNGLGKSHIIILDALLKMRQAACDPRLLKLESAKKMDAGSAKLERLMELLDEMLDEGRKIIIFSQFTSMLDLIRERLDARKFSYSWLTGDTKDRAGAVRDFQAGKVSLFLISLKAGGTGLNLTAADTVILYDPWWNPAVEAQAIDRAHRIGQDKPVFVHKLAVIDTIEEKMEVLKARKQALADMIHDHDGKSPLSITEEDIALLFSA
jgi:superfamily II DNA or RNA helicase